MSISAAEVAAGNIHTGREAVSVGSNEAVAGENALRLRFGWALLCLAIAGMASVAGCVLQFSPSGESPRPVLALQADVVSGGILGSTAIRQSSALPSADRMRNDAAWTATTVGPGGIVDHASLGETGQGDRAELRLEMRLPNSAAERGGIAMVLLRKSPAAGGGALFAVVDADGGVVQVHADGALDPLAPAGTVAPLTAPDFGARTGVVTRTGAILNWVPNAILYIADPYRNEVVALTLNDEGRFFRVEGMRRFAAAEFDQPVGLAPAVMERVNPGFASNTTLAGGADFYVANRGNGTVVRMRQDGTVLAVRSIRVAGLGVLGQGWLDGIAVAPDATRIRVSVSAPVGQFKGLEGAVLELPAFGPDGTGDRSLGKTRSGFGADVATPTNVALQMVGPLFNGRSCADCHRSPVAGGMGTDGLATVLRVGKLDRNGYDPMVDRGGPIARMHSISELGVPCRATPGIPPGANLVSVRNAPALFGLGLVDEIPEAAILAGAVARTNGIHGHPNIVTGPDGAEAVGRFGWKAEVPRLEQFVAEALRSENGIPSPLAPDLAVSSADCGAAEVSAKDDGTLVHSLTDFVRSLEPVLPRSGDAAGRKIFVGIGCADCHTPSLAAGDEKLPLYSDLLLHDMGPALNDGVVQGQARGSDWRTTPLWGLSLRRRFLHDGRARSIEAAILSHGGEADEVVQAFRELDTQKRSTLLDFLSSL